MTLDLFGLKIGTPNNNDNTDYKTTTEKTYNIPKTQLLEKLDISPEEVKNIFWDNNKQTLKIRTQTKQEE